MIDLKKTIQCSFYIHLGLCLFLWIIQFFFHSSSPRFIPTLKVDLVALPDTLKKDIHEAAENHLKEEITQVLKTVEKKISQKKNQMLLQTQSKQNSIQKTEKKNSLALKRIQSLSKVMDGEEVENSAPLLKGNRLSPGTSLSGEAQERLEANYYDVIRNILQKNWVLPTWIARQNFTAQTKIFLNSQGYIQKFQFIQKSGNQKFDEAVSSTIEMSSPFPSPPKTLIQKLLKDGVLIGFPL